MKTGINAWMGFCDDCLSTVDWLARCGCDRPIELAQARTTDLSFVRAEVRPSLLGAAIRASHGQEVPPVIVKRLATLGKTESVGNVLYMPV